MPGRILRSSDYQRMPWKNGGGTTTEIWKQNAADGALLWRLSIADVASDGPFSEFPGLDRWIMVIEGNGMELDIAGQGLCRIQQLFEPLAFSGDAKTDCRLLGGPIRDFNLMVARDHAAGDLQVLSLSPGLPTELDRDIVALHLLDGGIEIGVDAPVALAVGDSWIAAAADRTTIRVLLPSRLAAVTLTMAPGQPRA
jgi:environmental stress-induced protein Ves